MRPPTRSNFQIHSNFANKKLFTVFITTFTLLATLLFSPTISNASQTKGVGDISDAMRYGVSGPIGTTLSALHYQDDATTKVSLPTEFSSINFYGTKYSALCISTNGTIFPIPTSNSNCPPDNYDLNLTNLATSSSGPVIAALALDMDLRKCGGTRTPSGGYGDTVTSDGFGIPCEIYFGSTTVNGKSAIAVTWYRVATFQDWNTNVGSAPILFNTFQVVFIKKDSGSDSTGFDFDVELNIGNADDNSDGYNSISPGSECNPVNPSDGGSGDRTKCRWGMGWANYSGGSVTEALELFASTPIDDLSNAGGTKALVRNSLNSVVFGRYTWSMVGGQSQGFQIPVMGNGVSGTPVDSPPPAQTSAAPSTSPATPAQANSTIYFSEFSSRLTSTGKRQIRSMVTDLKAAKSIEVVGYVQRRKSDSKNDIRLSTARANSVRKYLRQLGVRVPVTIRGVGLPESNYIDPTARRVEIWLK